MLPVEIYELSQLDNENELAEKIVEHLKTIKHNKPEFGHLIDDGLGIVNSRISV